jgi:UMF1 family MFS transporter
MYDWANSAYSTISITVLVMYIISVWDQRAWGWGVGVTVLLAAIASPISGAIADAQASKHRWLTCTALTGAAASALMFFATPDRPWLLLVLFLIAHFFYELSFCFYNAFLPELATDETMGRVSAWGFVLGYFGGGVALLVVMLLITQGHHVGLPRLDDDRTALLPRLGLLIMGLWWGVFSLPAILWLRDRQQSQRGRLPVREATRKAAREVLHTLRHIGQYRVLAIFLVGFLLYNDGVQTIIIQASVFAERVLSMKTDELIPVILMIQFVSVPGAWLVGWLGDKIGEKPALVGCLITWIGLLIYAFFVNTKTQFWYMAIVAALVMGGTQSVSRAIMGQMTPRARAGEFFGFFNLSGKAASFMGPPLFSTVLAATGSAHWAIASLLVFFLSGLAIIAVVNVQQGRAQARAAEVEAP